MIRTTRFILILTFFMSGVLFSCGNQGGEENVLNPADSIMKTLSRLTPLSLSSPSPSKSLLKNRP